MQPTSQLTHILGQIPWDLTQSAQDNIEHLPEVLDEPGRYPAIAQLLNRPIPGLRRVKIYYPMTEDYYHPVEYATQRDITPIEVLNSMSEFYAQPFTQANADAIGQLMGQEVVLALPDDRVADLLGGHVFFEGLMPYQDAFTLSLGS